MKRISKIKRVFKFKPFSKKQRKVLNWWCEDSPVKDKDGICLLYTSDAADE